MAAGSLPVAARTSAREAVSAADSCPSLLLLASRGSGDKIAKDEGIGRPELAFETELLKLRPATQTWANLYPAVGVFSWPWQHISQIVNGVGALTKLSGLGLGAYNASLVTGTADLAAEIRQTVKRCGAQTKFILAGYSQGAQVTADVYQRSLTAGERAHVAAVVLFGDPSFNASDKMVDRGSFSGHRNGILGQRPPFTGKALVLSYCHSHTRAAHA